MIKKELGVYLRVPGNDQQKSDSVNTLAWGLRLTYNYLRSITTIEHEDWRIDYHRQQYM